MSNLCGEHRVPRKQRNHRLGPLVAAAALALSVSKVQAVTQFFDWEVPDLYPTGKNITPSPFLSNSSASSVDLYPSKRPAGSPLAEKIEPPLTTTAATNIFKKYRLNYVFADFEGTDSISQTTNLKNQLK